MVKPKHPEISVVIPLFNEAETFSALYQRLSRALRQLACSYEIVFVNDGSTDATVDLLRDAQVCDPCVTVIHLSRNFGHQPAVSAGIDHAKGNAVIVMDGDLQDPPEVLDRFLRAWREGFEVVYAIRTGRKENLWKRTAYSLFYRLWRAMSKIDVPLDSGDFCLMDRKVVDVLKHMPEKMRFLRGLRAFVGFRQIGIRYERAARHAGEPKYTFRALFRLAIDGWISFSNAPLTCVTFLGAGVLGLAFAATLWLIVGQITSTIQPPHGTGLAAVVLAVGGLQLLSLGIVGEYVRRIFWEVKNRPAYIVRDIRQIESADSAEAVETTFSNEPRTK